MDYKKRLYGITEMCSKFGNGSGAHILGCALLHYNRKEGGGYNDNLLHEDIPERKFYMDIVNTDINLVHGLLQLKQFYIDEYNAKFEE